MLAIITDSTSDLRQHHLDDIGVTRVPLYVNFQGNVYKDWLELTPKEIIDGVQQGADLPKTSQPTPADFEEAYKAATEAGATEILCLTISSALSGTHQSATIASEGLEIPITIFDSRTASLGLGMMVKQAATMRDAGVTLSEVIPVMEHMRDHSNVYFTVGTLDFLQKGGRIGRASALLGSLLNIKPILKVEEGAVAPAGRVRSKKKALREIIQLVEALVMQSDGQLHVAFVHVQDPEDIGALQEALAALSFDYVDQGVFEMGAVIAAHTGPGTYGICASMVPTV